MKTCNEIESQLIFFLESELSEAENQRIARHIEACQDCAAKLQYLNESLSLIDAEKAIEVKPFLFTRIEARMQPRGHSERRLILIPLAAASILAIGLFLGTFVGNLSVKQENALVKTEHDVAYLFDDAGLENAEMLLLNN